MDLLPALVSSLQEHAAKKGVPIDGLVASFDDVAYSKSLGHTGHHYWDGLALKFADETEETILTKVEWNVSRKGELAPVAIFDTVILDGTEVSRASLHNMDMIQKLDIRIGDRVEVSKRHMIIPHIEDNLDKNIDRTALKIKYPQLCPACGIPISVSKESISCKNVFCSGRKLRQLVHFTGKKAMDIAGLSEGTLKKFMDIGILNCELDVYTLSEHDAYFFIQSYSSNTKKFE